MARERSDFLSAIARMFFPKSFRKARSARRLTGKKPSIVETDRIGAVTKESKLLQQSDRERGREAQRIEVLHPAQLEVGIRQCARETGTRETANVVDLIIQAGPENFESRHENEQSSPGAKDTPKV